MPNFQKIEDKNEAAKVYLQIFARALAAEPRKLKIKHCYNEEKPNTVSLVLDSSFGTLTRTLVLNEHPTMPDLITMLNVTYDFLEIAHNKPTHYQKGSNITADEMLNANIGTVDAYMQEFEKLMIFKTVDEYACVVDRKAQSEDLQMLVALATGTPLDNLKRMAVKRM